jgi:hypothetical protein
MTVESDRDLAGLLRAGRVVALAIEEMKTALEPGMTTAELDAGGPWSTSGTRRRRRRGWCTGSPVSTLSA